MDSALLARDNSSNSEDRSTTEQIARARFPSP